MKTGVKYHHVSINMFIVKEFRLYRTVVAVMGKSKAGGVGGVSNNGHHGAPPPSPKLASASAPATDRGEEGHPSSRFAIKLSASFLLPTVCIPIVIAFLVGWIARLILLSRVGLHPYSPGTGSLIDYYDSTGYHSYYHHERTMDHPHPSISMSKKNLFGDDGVDYNAQTTMSGKKKSRLLPAPKVIEGKDVPFTTYASKTFQMAGAATSHTLHIDRTTAMIMSRSKKEFDGGPNFQEGGLNNNNEGDNDDGWVPCESNACSRGKENKSAASSLHFQPGANNNDDDLHNDDSDGLHLPAGQHLLVDIKDVDSNFLNSEERLATAMIELINESKLTLLSYHCHSLVPIGVSCAGVLLESHVAFHTWPLEGIITMDLFTCGGGLLIPTLPSIEELFGVPSEERSGDEESVAQPTMLWSHKLRGFREGFAPGYVRSNNPLDGSLGRYVLGKLDFDIKYPLLSTKTAYQSVNIYEVMEPTFRDVHSYHKSLRAEDGGGKSYESSHPEHFGPDKVLFLDGILQSTLFGDAPYHESIVHPAMITHTNPKRVAIIGGGEGATLREVLKYKSVREVVVLEIDEDLIKICAQYMPEWSDCSDIEGSNVTSCFDDSRATMVIGDAIKWFIDNFVDNVENAVEEKFDVIIMDALDTGGLYNNTSFVNSLFYGLSADGVFSAQVGKSKMNTDPPDEIGRFKDTGLMIKALNQAGFGSIHSYDEGHSHFFMPWSYIVALKDYKSRADWYRTGPELQLAIQQGLHRKKSGKSSLRYFDAATMVSYQLPSKAQESTYCRVEKNRSMCDKSVGLQLDLNSLKVDNSVAGEHAGRGLFAVRDIPSNFTIALDMAIKSFHVPPSTWSVLDSLYENSDGVSCVKKEISEVYSFIEGYGVSTVLMGETSVAIESSIMLFANHGCNGTYNFGVISGNDHDNKCTEADCDVRSSADLTQHVLIKAPAYCPIYERNIRRLMISGGGWALRALRDIKKGEEILVDYLTYWRP